MLSCHNHSLLHTPVSSFQNGAFKEVGVWSHTGGLRLTEPVIWPGLNAELSPAQEVPRTVIRLTPEVADAAIGISVGLSLVFVCTIHWTLASLTLALCFW